MKAPVNNVLAQCIIHKLVVHCLLNGTGDRIAAHEPLSSIQPIGCSALEHKPITMDSFCGLLKISTEISGSPGPIIPCLPVLGLFGIAAHRFKSRVYRCVQKLHRHYPDPRIFLITIVVFSLSILFMPLFNGCIIVAVISCRLSPTTGSEPTDIDSGGRIGHCSQSGRLLVL